MWIIIGNLGSGPLWFVEALLIFAFVYVLYRLLIKSGNKEIKIPGNNPIAIFALIIGIVTFSVRIWFPIGWNFAILNFQIPYFPQYIAMFIVGLTAYRGNWFLQIPEKTGKLWSRVAAVLLHYFQSFVHYLETQPDLWRILLAGFSVCLMGAISWCSCHNNIDSVIS